VTAALPPRDEVLDYLCSFDTYAQVGRAQEGVDYVTTHVDRFLRSLQFLPRLPHAARALELGSSPYYMSILLKKYRGYELTPANYFGDYGDAVSEEGFLKVGSEKYGESYGFHYKQFNLELDPFPYGDGEFDLVICCEILEHLARSPSHLMREAHRVLKPGGHLFITTPNVIRIDNLWNLLRGYNSSSAYSGFGVYGRHNREYTSWELGELYRAHNFVPTVHVEDAYDHGLASRLVTRFGRGKDRRDNLFGDGVKQGQTVERYPSWLYEYPQALRRVTQNHIVMGNRDYLQLGSGWSDFEYLPPGLRWIDDEAQAFLLAKGTRGELAVRCKGGQRGVEASLRVLDVDLGRIALGRDEEREFVFPIPASVIQQHRDGKLYMSRIDFKVSGGGSGALGPAEDRRRLGVARIEVR
jgi:SAM-dependent methyltransferase